MAAILARKLGMTQVFGEDGAVARVTVLAAGPCHVTAIRTRGARRLRRRAARLRRDQGEGAEQARARPPREGRRAADAPPRRVPRRGRRAVARRDRRRRASSSRGQRVKVSGVSKGKGFQGTIKRHRFSRGPAGHGSHNVRAPGSIGASATPSRVFKGIRGPGQMGNKRVTQRGLEIVEVRAEREPAVRARLGPGPAQRLRGGAQRWLTLPCSAPRARARSRSTTSPSARASTVRCCTSPCAPSWPRAGAAPPRRKTRGLVSGGNSKPWRQKGTGRARAGSTRSPIFTGGGVVFGPHPRSYTFKVNRKERRAALRSALSLHAQRGSLAILDAARLRRAVDQVGGRAARRLGRAAPDARRRDGRGARAPGCPSATSSASPCSSPENVGVVDLVGAASLLCSAAALEQLTARAVGSRTATEGEA